MKPKSNQTYIYTIENKTKGIARKDVNKGQGSLVSCMQVIKGLLQPLFEPMLSDPKPTIKLSGTKTPKSHIPRKSKRKSKSNTMKHEKSNYIISSNRTKE